MYCLGIYQLIVSANNYNNNVIPSEVSVIQLIKRFIFSRYLQGYFVNYEACTTCTKFEIVQCQIMLAYFGIS